MAFKYKISGRTFRDWRRGKFLPSLEILEAISKDFKIKLPSFKILPQYWYITPEKSRKAALIKMAKYGPPGTLEGRRKGGMISQRNRKENPKKYKALGCVVAKDFPILKPSSKLAELFGIILGDGTITKNQVRITLNRFTDKQYVRYVEKLITGLLKEKPSIFERKSTIEIYLSGVNLVKELERMGLKRGNKVKNQVVIPGWIMADKRYANACARGLFDTDGGLFIHKHGGGRWNNLGWCFTNHSLPLIENVREILRFNSIEPKGKKYKIYLYAVPDIRNFIKKVGSSNIKNIDKYRHYMDNFYSYEWKIRKGGRVA
ncbi:MAG: hypothetical protein PHF07_02065 [Candidatus Pacebacteria bacterium]|nr:hypothetical protein [Candidatus Paceibacterota bacterium]